MANSVPPIVTAVGGSPELVVDGESGLVVPPADSRALAAAIVKLYESEALRKRLGEAARERIRSAFPIGATIRQTAELYRSLVQP
jgi:glycosyltransferase involved in cell wall biosynthesis